MRERRKMKRGGTTFGSEMREQFNSTRVANQTTQHTSDIDGRAVLLQWRARRAQQSASWRCARARQRAVHCRCYAPAVVVAGDACVRAKP